MSHAAEWSPIIVFLMLGEGVCGRWNGLNESKESVGEPLVTMGTLEVEIWGLLA